MTAPSLLKQKQLGLGLVDRTRPNNNPAQDHQNIDGFICWQWNVPYIMYDLNCEGQNHNMGKVTFISQSGWHQWFWLRISQVLLWHVISQVKPAVFFMSLFSAAIMNVKGKIWKRKILLGFTWITYLPRPFVKYGSQNRQWNKLTIFSEGVGSFNSRKYAFINLQHI